MAKKEKNKLLTGISISEPVDAGAPKQADEIGVDSDEKNKRINQLLESSQTIARVGGWELDLKTNTLYWTAETYHIHDTSPNEFTPTIKEGIGYYLPESQKQITEAVEQAITQGKGYDLCLEKYTAKGRKIDVRTTCVVECVDGKPTKLIGIFQDITEQKKAEREINLLQQKYLAMLNNANGIVWEANAQTSQCTFVSGKAEAILGYPIHRWLDEPTFWKDHIHPEDREWVLEYCIRHTSKNQPYDLEYRMIAADGRVVWLHDTTNVESENGQPKIVRGLTVDITARKKTAELLKLSESNLKDAQSMAKLGWWEMNLVTNQLYWSDSVFEIFNIDKERFNATYEGYLGTLHPDDRQFVHDAYTHSLETKTPYKIEHRLQMADGSIKWVKGICRTDYDTHGNAIRSVGTVQDITEQTQSKEELRNANKKLDLFFAQSLEGFFFMMLDEPVEWNDTIDKEKTLEYVFSHQRITRVNDAMLKQYLATHEQLLNRTPNDLFAHDLSYGKKVWREFFDAGKLHIEKSEKRLDGSDMFVEGDYICMYDSENRIIGHFGIQRDVTIRVQMDQVLKNQNKMLISAKEKAEESDRKFKQAFENAGIGMALVSIQGKFIQVNQAVANTLGYSETELLTKTFQELTYPDDLKKDLHLLSQALEGTIDYYKIVKRYFHKSGTLVWANLNVTLVRDNQNLPLFFISQIEDISKQVISEQELIKAKEKAEESDRLKSAFLTNMRHEIRTPMNAIMGFSKRLAATDLSEAKRKEYSAIVVNNSYQLLSIVDDILSISLLETNQENVKNTEVSINDLLYDLQLVFISQAQSKGLSLTVSRPLPDNHSCTHTDKSKLTQIITNLLTNAIKFTHEGSVEFGYQLKDKDLQFFVKDSGIGIDVIHHKKIFERFQQVDNGTSRKYGGNGLGLSISKALIELLGGKIWLESEPGKGSVFYFNIPFHPVELKVQPPIINKKIDGKFTILVAEDQQVNFHFLKVVIKEIFNCEVFHAKNGKEAVEVVQNNPSINLVLMDINMPVLDGYEAAKQIKACKPNIGIIAQTGYDIETIKGKYGYTFFNDYITKPIDENILVEKIKLLVD